MLNWNNLCKYKIRTYRPNFLVGIDSEIRADQEITVGIEKRLGQRYRFLSLWWVTVLGFWIVPETGTGSARQAGPEEAPPIWVLKDVGKEVGEDSHAVDDYNNIW